METTGGQDPPIVSAETATTVKVLGHGGRHALTLIRRGHTVEVEPRGIRSCKVSVEALREAVDELGAGE